MRILDHRWPYQLGAVLIFVAVMAFLQFMMKGINEDFGIGFALGLATGAVIALVAAASQDRKSASERRQPSE